jgi:hypothetical protein
VYLQAQTRQHTLAEDINVDVPQVAELRGGFHEFQSSGAEEGGRDLEALKHRLEVDGDGPRHADSGGVNVTNRQRAEVNRSGGGGQGTQDARQPPGEDRGQELFAPRGREPLPEN